jgi:hypothetical protein
MKLCPASTLSGTLPVSKVACRGMQSVILVFSFANFSFRLSPCMSYTQRIHHCLLVLLKTLYYSQLSLSYCLFLFTLFIVGWSISAVLLICLDVFLFGLYFTRPLFLSTLLLFPFLLVSVYIFTQKNFCLCSSEGRGQGYITRNFMLIASLQRLLRWSNQEEWDGRGM